MKANIKHEERRQTVLTTNEECVTRRQMLRTFGAGAVAATVATAFSGTLAAAGAWPAESPIPGGSVKETVSPRSIAFNLADVRLLEGPFERAQE